MSRIQINLGLIDNVIMGARLRQHRLLDFVFVGNIISEPLCERSTLQSGPQISPLSAVSPLTEFRRDLEAVLFEHLTIITGVEARHHPSDPPTPCLVHQLTHTDEIRFLGTSGKMRYNINTTGRVWGITSFWRYFGAYLPPWAIQAQDYGGPRWLIQMS